MKYFVGVLFGLAFSTHVHAIESGEAIICRQADAQPGNNPIQFSIEFKNPKTKALVSLGYHHLQAKRFSSVVPERSFHLAVHVFPNSDSSNVMGTFFF